MSFRVFLFLGLFLIGGTSFFGGCSGEIVQSGHGSSFLMDAREKAEESLSNTQDPLFPHVPLLDKVDWDQGRVLARQSGSGGELFTAYYAQDAGQVELAEELFKKAAYQGKEPWASQGLKEWTGAAAPPSPRLLRLYLRAMEEAPRDKALRKAGLQALSLGGWKKSLADAVSGVLGIAEDELALRAAYEENRPELAQHLARFVLICSDPQGLEGIPAAGSQGESLFDPGTEILWQARLSWKNGRSPQALEGFFAWLDHPDTKEISPPVLEEISQAALEAKVQEEAARKLLEVASALEGEEQALVILEAGWLLRKGGAFQEAEKAYLGITQRKGGSRIKDKAFLALLRLSVSRGFSHERDVLAQTAPQWFRPSYFSYFLGDLIHRLVAAEAWEDLKRIYEETAVFWPGSSQAQGAYVLATGIVDGHTEGGEAEFTAYLEKAMNLYPKGWYGLRAAGILGREPSFVIREDSPQEFLRDLSPEDVYLRGLAAWGLTSRAKNLVFHQSEVYADESIRRTARALYAKEEYRSVIRVIARLESRPGYQPTWEDLLYRYPRPYRREITTLTQDFSLPMEIVDGIIYVESAWDKDAVSRVGARGLMQLMPATAEEWLGRLRLDKEADLGDPQVNLQLGTAYANWLRSREWTQGWTDILLAYNAGGGNLRRWQRRWPSFKNTLLVEAVPYAEARLYARRVLSAATLYGYLYLGMLPQDLHQTWGLDAARP